MKRKSRFIPATVLFVIASCAVITVNIYFPEKDVKEAYKALEKELMAPEQEMQQKPPEGKPESSIRFRLVPAAYAQEPGLADRIAEIVKNMPEVVNAYRDMGARVADTERLRDSGLVGEGNTGLLLVRDKGISAADKAVVDIENANRKTVMEGMAKAIIRINRVPQTEDNMRQVMPQAVEQFASIRRDTAKKGWWIQIPDGNWSRK